MPVQTHHDILIELSVPDFQIAKDFYTKLGFEEIWQEDPRDMNGYLVMRRGDSVLCFFCGNDRVYDHPYFSQFPRDTKRGYGVEFSIPADDIDALYTRLRASLPAGHFVQELRLQPWGIKDFRMVDPFGYYFRVNDPTDMITPLTLGDKNYSDSE